jgi:NADH:ubiquinone oxidoreductase subunit 4 (subunit M)
VCFGEFSAYLSHSAHYTETRDLNRREWLVLLPLILLTLILGVFPNLIMDILHSSVINLTTYI